MIKQLRERVALRCSKPECRVPTYGPGEESDSSAHIGQAAHIAAAAPGGPRFDPEMTPEQRSSFANGIWLCCNHAREVDANRAAYPPDLLKKWKEIAEQRARDEKGRRLPEPDDARDAVLAALIAAPPPFTRTAISNAHAATKERLDKLDSRLWVETSYTGGVTHFGIHAREDVPCQFEIPPTSRDLWRSGMAELNDHGREARLPATGLKVTGSPLFEFLFETNSLADAYLTIGPTTKKKAVEKLRLTDPSTGAIEQFDDIHGSITSGRKSGAFEGQACGGAMSTSLRLERGEGLSPGKATFGLTIHFDRWDGIDVRALPYFDKLHSMIERMHAGWHPEIELEIDGQSMGRAPTEIGDLGPLDSIAQYLEYLSAVRAIAGYVGSQVQFRCDTTLSDSTIREAFEVRDRIKGRRVFGPEVRGVKMTLTTSGDNIQRLLAPDAALQVQMPPRELKAFGQPLILPPTRIDLINFQARIATDNVNVGALKDGDLVSIELLPAKGFQCVDRYLGPDNLHEPVEQADTVAQSVTADD